MFVYDERDMYSGIHECNVVIVKNIIKIYLDLIRERGNNGLFNTSPQSFIKVFSHLLLLILQWILIGWFIKLSVQTLQPLILIYINYHWDIHQFIGYCLVPLDPWDLMEHPFSLCLVMRLRHDVIKTGMLALQKQNPGKEESRKYCS